MARRINPITKVEEIDIYLIRVKGKLKGTNQDVELIFDKNSFEEWRCKK